MSNLSDAFESPIIFREGGLDLTIPKLDIDDHVAWCAQLQAERRPVRLKTIPGNAPPAERSRLQQKIEFEEPTLSDIADLIYTAKGARECVRRGLVKGGMDDATATATMKRVPAWQIQRLAVDVSGLFRREPPPEAGEGDQAPLTPAGAGGQSEATSTPAIGDSSDSRSGTTSDTPTSAA